MSSGQSRILGCTISLIAGIAVAIVIHFMLYRIGIPLQPFIYVVF